MINKRLMAVGGFWFESGPSGYFTLFTQDSQTLLGRCLQTWRRRRCRPTRYLSVVGTSLPCSQTAFCHVPLNHGGIPAGQTCGSFRSLDTRDIKHSHCNSHTVNTSNIHADTFSTQRDFYKLDAHTVAQPVLSEQTGSHLSDKWMK